MVYLIWKEAEKEKLKGKQKDEHPEVKNYVGSV